MIVDMDNTLLFFDVFDLGAIDQTPIPCCMSLTSQLSCCIHNLCHTICRGVCECNVASFV